MDEIEENQGEHCDGNEGTQASLVFVIACVVHSYWMAEHIEAHQELAELIAHI